MHMILCRCKSFTIDSDIFLWGSGVGGKLPGAIAFKEITLSHFWTAGSIWCTECQGRLNSRKR